MHSVPDHDVSNKTFGHDQRAIRSDVASEYCKARVVVHSRISLDLEGRHTCRPRYILIKTIRHTGRLSRRILRLSVACA